MPLKGFAITPVLFIALALIVSLQLYFAFSLSTRSVSAVESEAALSRLRADALERESRIASLIYWSGIESNSSNCSEMQAHVRAALQGSGFGGSVEITPDPPSHSLAFYTEQYSASAGSASLSRNMSVTERIPALCS